MNQKSLNYQLYKVASETYQKSAETLSEAEAQEALRISQRKIHIEKAILSSPEATKISVPTAQIDQAMEALSQRYEDKTEFFTAIESLSLTQEEFYQALSRELHVEAVMDYVGSDSQSVSETDISLFYYMNTEKFNRPEIRTARHILISINDDSTENFREASFKKISAIQQRLQKKPTRFEEQALKHSECPTALQGGLLGDVKRGVLYPELEEVLFNLQAGEISNIAESELGFHVLRCDVIKQAGVAPLAEIADKLKFSLEERNRKQAQRKWLDALLKKVSSESNYEEIAHG